MNLAVKEKQAVKQQCKAERWISLFNEYASRRSRELQFLQAYENFKRSEKGKD